MVALLVFLGAIEAARRVRLTRTFVLEPRPDVVLERGPYAFVRHPIYLSYSLAWLAAPVAIHSVTLGATAVLMIAGYITSAAREEAYLLNEPARRPVPPLSRADRRGHPVRRSDPQLARGVGPSRSSPRSAPLLLTTDKSGGILHVECRQGRSTCCKAPSIS